MVSFSRGKLPEPMAAGLDSLLCGGEGAATAGESSEGPLWIEPSPRWRVWAE